MQRRYLLICGVVFLLAAADAADDVKKELARFEGTWKIISLETEQNKLTEDALKHIQLKLEGDKFTTVDENRETRGTFKPDPSKKPKTIDMTMTDGPLKGKTMLGIYELEGDTYKVCVDVQGKSRPTEFAVKPGSGYVLEILNREKK
ncbi:MAG TPA: TIGR03067 domain-containing protein [Gemmataceae bacterium]|nr:TIGR03067 domain-containing protein [Gemmataceae bacterium]